MAKPMVARLVHRLRHPSPSPPRRNRFWRLWFPTSPTPQTVDTDILLFGEGLLTVEADNDPTANLIGIGSLTALGSSLGIVGDLRSHRAPHNPSTQEHRP